MSRYLPVAVVQADPLPVDGAVEAFGEHAAAVVADFGQAELLIYPELHVCGLDGRPSERETRIAELAEPLDGPRMTALRGVAADLGRWMIPGSVYELGDDGSTYNTAVVLSPRGEIVASYRKMFPWRPYETQRPGDRFVTVDLPHRGRLGLSICYDTWFPEVSRHLAWMGAEVIVTPTLTATSDRPQEIILSQANAIANQVYVISVNAAAPAANGGSLIVDPEGIVRSQAGAHATVISDVLDLDAVSRVRRFGTVGLTRVWDQFSDDDAAIPLPLYAGRLDPATWGARPGG